jgi:uncharacterized membrane protein
MKILWSRIQESIKGRSPGLIGATIGLTLSLLLVIFGFFKTLFIITLTLIGYLIGVRYFANKEDFRDLLDKLLPPGLFR